MDTPNRPDRAALEASKTIRFAETLAYVGWREVSWSGLQLLSDHASAKQRSAMLAASGRTEEIR